MTLIRSKRPEDDLDSLRARLTALEAALYERATAVAEAKSSLAAFRLRYHADVGVLHEELDDLERAIAEAELGEMAKRLETDETDANQSAGSRAAGGEPRFTSDAVRTLFRDVAKTIHPDLARDDLTRERRHALMAEANRAYAVGDEDRLRRILEAWRNSPDAVPGDDPEAARLRIVRRMAEIQEALAQSASELAALKESPLWQLKAMVDEAALRGKDLVADMVRRLKRDIMAAQNRLDAMRWNP